MKRTRRKFTTSFKTKVVLEAIKERQSLQVLSQKYAIHPNQITAWKAHFLSNAEKVFDTNDDTIQVIQSERDDLFREIGKMKMEMEWLKKKLS